MKINSNPYGIYQGYYRFGDVSSDTQGYKYLTGKSPALSFIFHDWTTGPIDSPHITYKTFNSPIEDGTISLLDLAKNLYDKGTIAAVTWDIDIADPGDAGYYYGTKTATLTLDSILSGKHDDYIATVADELKAYGKPIMLSPFGEIDTTAMFAFGAHGTSYMETVSDTKGQYGDPTIPDGPERVRDTYKHIEDIFNAKGVNNVTWFMYASTEFMNSAPQLEYRTDLMHPKYFYPGDNYVDWVGQSAYFIDPKNPPDFSHTNDPYSNHTVDMNQFFSFTDTLKGGYDAWQSVTNKPFFIPEFGMVGNNSQDRSSEIIEALGIDLQTRFPNVKALTFVDSDLAQAFFLTPKLGQNSSEIKTLHDYIGNNPYFLDSALKALDPSYFSDKKLVGSVNDDVIFGGAGNDKIDGKNGNDVIYGGAGNDTIDGGLGNDTMIGGAGVDTLSYASANHSVTVNLSITNAQNTIGSGIDTISGFENLRGSAFNDRLTGNIGNNVINGGAGNDTIDGGLGNDTLIGGSGMDTLSYASANHSVTVNLSITNGQNTVGSGIDTISGFENLTGSAFNDTLTGSYGNNTIAGGAGNDTIDGGLGNDTLIGGSGMDTLSYASANHSVAVNLSLISAQNTIGSGIDTISGFENLVGSAFNDTLTGNYGNNTIAGGAGNDTIDGGLGNDTLIGGSGVDTLSYASGNHFVNVNLSITSAQNTIGSGIDTISGFENLRGSAFNDVLTGSAGNNVIFGGAGKDTLIGGLGADILTGGSGADTFKFMASGLDNNKDHITDFHRNEGDKIDLKDILVGYDSVTKAITDFVEFTTSGTNTIIKVDRDGAGTHYGWQQIAIIDNATGLTDEYDLKAKGNIIA